MTNYHHSHYSRYIMKNKLHQILYDMRRQPLISGVTFIATALSVFLFMIVMITQRVKTIPFSPESCRERLLIGEHIHVVKSDGFGDSSSQISYYGAKTLYDGLEGVERISYMEAWTDTKSAKGSENNFFQVSTRTADADFFKIFDHPLIAGRYFTVQEANSDLPVTVITETTARKAFGTTDCIGRDLSLNHSKYRVVGVVKDHSALATIAAGDVFLPYAPGESAVQSDKVNNLFGGTMVALLMKPGADAQSIRNQVKARYAILDTEIKPEGWHTVYHEAPYDRETIASGMFGSNNTPDISGARNMRYLLYAILLIVPAINLSSLLHSRMRRRVNEIGIRRAYGCTRAGIVRDIIAENFIVTLIGGIAGVALGITFALTYSGLYENMDTYGTEITPAIGSILNWGTIIAAIAVCFILNIISASIPAWQASRLNPVEAINSK